jgi:hypothetical protein
MRKYEKRTFKVLRMSTKHQLHWGHLSIVSEEETTTDEYEEYDLSVKRDILMYMQCDCENYLDMSRSEFMKKGGRRKIRDCGKEDCKFVIDRKRLEAEKVEARKEARRKRRRVGGGRGRPVLYGARALNKSVRMSGEMNDRIQVVAKEMGKAWNRAAVLLLESALKRVED